MRGADWGLLFASFSLYLATFYVRSPRWRVLLPDGYGLDLETMRPLLPSGKELPQEAGQHV